LVLISPVQKADTSRLPDALANGVKR
jgi:hypothetical protein